MIYNGEAENGKCLANRASHTGYASSTIQNLTANYWYGTDYIYDSETKTFKVSGTTEQVTWNGTTGSELIGKYTCKSNSKDESCSSIYLVESYYDSTSAHAIPIVTNSYNYQYGTLQYNVNNNSPAYVGYMYGDVYNYDTITIRKTEDFTKSLTILHMVQPYIGTRYNYSNSVDYGNINADKYTLTGGGFQLDTTDNMSKVLGKYTFMRSSGGNSGTSVRYIAGVSGRTLYYISLTNGKLLSDYEPIMFGDSITENEDGTYTINNPIPVTLSEWYTSSKNYKNKYTCNDSSITCSNPRYITDSSYASYSYINAGEKIIIGKTRSGLTLTDTLLVRKDELVINSSNYSDYKYTCNTDSITCSKENLRMIESYNNKGYNYISNYNYGSSITWDGEKYTLVDPIEIENYNNLNNLSTHHFMCPSPGDISCTSVAYIYYYTGTGAIYYIKLKDGVTNINTILDNMFKKNNTNSTIKTGVDAWYKHYLLEDYDKYIEDTIFCNDRSIRLLNGWDPNGGMTCSFLYFKESNVTNDFSCINVTDQFSIFNNNAKLTYKVGLVSSPEINALNNSSARNPSYIYRTISPYMFSYNTASNTNINEEGSITKSDVSYGLGVRPTISLKPNIQYLEGNGSRSNPYIIDTRTTYNVNVEIVNETENFDINLEDMTKVYEGEDVIFKVTPITGYKLTNIKVLDSNNNEIEFTNTSNENEYTFTMPASNVTIIPSYKKNRFNISVTVKNEEKDFDINVEDMTSVLEGEEVTFKVTPITGYKINSIEILDSNNNEVTFTETSNENEYTFIMSESDITIIPSYERVSSSIEVEESDHTKELTIAVNDVSAVVYEDLVVFTVIPEKGYEVDSIDIKD
ncbi:MAG: hypothetical protein IKI04_02860, partial [Bacilli bacterium]|nr:hypothetical protein [Bacilli bacterium]